MRPTSAGYYGGGSANYMMSSSSLPGLAAIYDMGRFTPLPDHLRYKAPVVNSGFEYVAPRYQSPVQKKVIDTDKRYESPTKNSPFRNVPSRFTSPPKPKPTAAEINNAQRLSPQQSIRMTSEILHHKRVAAAAGIKDVPSKYMDVWEHPSAQRPASPRTQAQERLKREAELQEGRLQHPRMDLRGAKTFQEMEKDNPRLRLWNSPSKKSGRTSVVMAYVKDGVAIPTSRPPPPQPSPPKSRAPSPPKFVNSDPFFGGGGAGGGAFNRRTNSPKKMVVTLEEQRVKSLLKSMNTAKISSPPRVATTPRHADTQQPQTTRGRQSTTPPPPLLPSAHSSKKLQQQATTPRTTTSPPPATETARSAPPSANEYFDASPVAVDPAAPSAKSSAAAASSPANPSYFSRSPLIFPAYHA